MTKQTQTPKRITKEEHEAWINREGNWLKELLGRKGR